MTKKHKGHREAPVAPVAEPRETSRWGTAAAILGGATALGTLMGALFMLRGSTPRRRPGDASPAGGAHQADGTDSSAEFNAGIADEGMIPETGNSEAPMATVGGNALPRTGTGKASIVEN